MSLSLSMPLSHRLIVSSSHPPSAPRLLAGSSGVHFLVSPISGPILRVMNTATFFLINVLFTMLVFINLLGCMWWFTAEVEGLEDSWVAYAGVAFDVVNASSAAQYVTSVYFAMTVITTVGFGDITPQTVAEMLVAMLFMGIGLFYFGYIVSAVSSLVNMVNHQARGTQIVREKLEEIDVWASARHIPRNLRQEVKTYYLEVWAPHCGVRLDDADKFRELPAALRAELVLSLSGEALRRSYMLSALDMDMMEFLATLGLPFPLIAGHDLYMEGAPADKFWVLQEGELTVMRGITKIGVIVGPAVIGQAAIFSKLLDDCQNRMHTMRAAVNCTLWEFAAGPFSHMLRYRPKVLVRLCLRYRDHLMHLQRKFGKRAPRRVYRMIESLGTIAWWVFVFVVSLARPPLLVLTRPPLLVLVLTAQGDHERRAVHRGGGKGVSRPGPGCEGGVGRRRAPRGRRRPNRRGQPAAGRQTQLCLLQ